MNFDPVELVERAGHAEHEHVAARHERGERVSGVIAVGEVGTDRPRPRQAAERVIDRGMAGAVAARARAGSGRKHRAVGAQHRRADLARRQVAVALLGAVLQALRVRARGVQVDDRVTGIHPALTCDEAFGVRRVLHVLGEDRTVGEEHPALLRVEVGLAGRSELRPAQRLGIEVRGRLRELLAHDHLPGRQHGIRRIADEVPVGRVTERRPRGRVRIVNRAEVRELQLVRSAGVVFAADDRETSVGKHGRREGARRVPGLQRTYLRPRAVGVTAGDVRRVLVPGIARVALSEHGAVRHEPSQLHADRRLAPDELLDGGRCRAWRYRGRQCHRQRRRERQRRKQPQPASRKSRFKNRTSQAMGVASEGRANGTTHGLGGLLRLRRPL